MTVWGGDDPNVMAGFLFEVQSEIKMGHSVPWDDGGRSVFGLAIRLGFCHCSTFCINAP